MKQGGKIVVALVVLTLCMGVNLYAGDRSRHVGVNNGDLNLNILQQLGVVSSEPLEFNAQDMTINGQDVTITGDRTGYLSDGTRIEIIDEGNRSRITVGDQQMVLYANGLVGINSPDTTADMEISTIRHPVTGMPMKANGALSMADFQITQEEAQPVAAMTEYDRLMQYQESAKDSTVQSVTLEFGGLEITHRVDGAALLDPTLPEKLLAMDEATLEQLEGLQLPVHFPTFALSNGNLLFPHGARKTLE